MTKSIATRKKVSSKKYKYFFSDWTGNPCRIDQYVWDLVDQHFIQN